VIVTLSAGLVLVSLAALLLFVLLVILNSGRSAVWENALHRGLVVLCLALAAAGLLFRLQPSVSLKEPFFFLLAEENLLRSEPEKVRSEALMASHSSMLRLASFRLAGKVPAEKEATPAETDGPPVERRFSSPVAAMGWVELEAGGREEVSVAVLSEEGIRLHAPPGMNLYQVVMPAARTETKIEELSVPPLVFDGSQARVLVKFRSAAEEGYSLCLFDGEHLREERPIGKEKAPTEGIEMVMENMRKGSHILRVEIRDGEGTPVAREYARLNVRESPRIGYFLEPGFESPLPSLLEEWGYQVATFSADGILSGIDGERGEIVIFENVPASRLSWPVVSSLYRSVSAQGGGVLVIGGDRSFGPGGYTGSAIERLMPVWMGLKNRDSEKHNTAFLVILDTSTSMLCPPEGCATDEERMWGAERAPRGPRVRKIDLARQSLLNLLPAMRGMDYFGILGGRISPYWEVEPGSMESLEELEAKIMAIQGGGTGIYLYSSLLESRKIMAGLDSEIKHIVTLIDTDDVHERKVMGLGSLDELVRLLNEDDISLSFIGLGFSDDQYVPLLSRLASRTGGYLYLRLPLPDLRRERTPHLPPRRPGETRPEPGHTQAPAHPLLPRGFSLPGVDPAARGPVHHRGEVRCPHPHLV
jgi:hypothetical protein